MGSTCWLIQTRTQNHPSLSSAIPCAGSKLIAAAPVTTLRPDSEIKYCLTLWLSRVREEGFLSAPPTGLLSCLIRQIESPTYSPSLERGLGSPWEQSGSLWNRQQSLRLNEKTSEVRGFLTKPNLLERRKGQLVLGEQQKCLPHPTHSELFGSYGWWETLSFFSPLHASAIYDFKAGEHDILLCHVLKMGEHDIPFFKGKIYTCNLFLLLMSHIT